MLHFRIFAVGQASRLFQYFIAYRYLSDVMECAGKIHFLGGVLVKSHKPGQTFRIVGHTQRMCTGKGRFVVYNFRKEFCQSFYLRKIKLLLGTRHLAPQALLQPPAAKRAKMLF